jgi:hypothetical protein
MLEIVKPYIKYILIIVVLYLLYLIHCDLTTIQKNQVNHITFMQEKLFQREKIPSFHFPSHPQPSVFVHLKENVPESKSNMKYPVPDTDIETSEDESEIEDVTEENKE